MPQLWILCRSSFRDTIKSKCIPCIFLTLIKTQYLHFFCVFDFSQILKHVSVIQVLRRDQSQFFDLQL